MTNLAMAELLPAVAIGVALAIKDAEKNGT